MAKRINFVGARQETSGRSEGVAGIMEAGLPWVMNETTERKPDLPKGARALNVGDPIQDGDLHWNPSVKHWVAVTPQGDEKVEPGQDGFYCRTAD